MNCDEVRPLLDAYVDNELDLVSSLAIERHLPTCPDCQPIYQNRLTLREQLGHTELYYHAPASLEGRLKVALRKADPPRRPVWFDWLIDHRRLSGTTAAILIILAIGIGLLRDGSAPGGLDTVSQEVLASHIRSLMAAHLTDVTSTDQHTVKPWFDGKLDYVPTVIDLAGQGYPLIGGRLDYLDDQPVCALVYAADKHLINLFIWPTTESGQPDGATVSPQGYSLVHWTQGHLTYWAVSDLESNRLQRFGQLIRAAITGG